MIPHNGKGDHARRAALPVSADDASGSAAALRRELPWFWAYLSLLPAPDSCCVCDRVGGSRTGREPGRRSRRLEGVLDAAAWERIMPAGGGRKGRGLVRGFIGGVLAFLSGG